MKKKTRVHRLPTKDITNILVNTYVDPEKHSQSPILDVFSRNTVYLESGGDIKVIESRGFKFQHLYITTDEKPKVGDWTILSFGGNGMVCQMKEGESGGEKIIATTNSLAIKQDKFDVDKIKEWFVPQIPQSFIEEYCKAGGIDEVLVEHELYQMYKPEQISWEQDPSGEEQLRTDAESMGYKPKLDSNNCIIIHPVEEKMYSKAEVRQAILDYGYTVTGEGDIERNLDKWIEENL